jgi:type IV pilus secretin PilQ/predicted competence protein
LASITKITTDSQGDVVQIVVDATDEVQYTTFRLQQPPRLAVDIADATLSPDVKPVTFSEGIVSGVEPVVFADEHVVRVLVPLRQPASHLVTAVGNQLHIALSADGDTDGRAANDGAVGDSTVDDRTIDHRAADGTVDNHEAEPYSEAADVEATSEVVPTAPADHAGTLIHGIEFLSLPGASVIEVQVAGSLPQIRVKQQTNPLRLMMDVENARLNPKQNSLMAVHDPAGVVAQLQALQSTHEDTDTVHIVAYLKAKAPFEVRQQDDRVRVILTPPVMPTAVEVPAPDDPTATASMPLIAQASPLGAMDADGPMVAQSTPTTPETDTGGVPPRIEAATIGEVGEKTYTGEKISLDFQNADINDILRLIAEVSHLNIIAGPDVKGTITTRMVDIPWDQALDVVLKINGLDKEQRGNIIRVAPVERFINEHQERMRVQKAEEEAEPTVKQVVPINYANVEELKTNLERVLSSRGSLWIDSRTNTMIVTDVKENVKHVMDLVETLDRQTPQVMIESRIVEASRNFLKELGVRLGTRFAQTTDNNFPSTVAVGGGVTGDDAGNFLVDLPAAVGAGSGGAITFALAGAGSLLNLQLSALENSGNGKVVTNPKIATLDNTEALIESGRRIPYPTRDDNGTKIEFADASIQLRVTPHVAPDGFINMKIHATKNEADFSNAVQGVPTILTREATTEMLVRDGSTVVIGGLYQRSLQASQSGIPWLSNVPGLGWLFRNTRDNDTHEELLIFITPRIIKQPDVPSKAHASVMH